MHRVILDVDIVNGRTPSHVLDFDKVVGLDAATIAAKPIPPCGAVAVEDSEGGGGDFDVGAADDYKGVVCCGVLPERGAREGYFGATLQLGEVDGAVAGYADVVQGDVRAGGYCRGDLRVLGYMADGVEGWRRVSAWAV